LCVQIEARFITLERDPGRKNTMGQPEKNHIKKREKKRGGKGGVVKGGERLQEGRIIRKHKNTEDLGDKAENPLRKWEEAKRGGQDTSGKTRPCFEKRWLIVRRRWGRKQTGLKIFKTSRIT